MISSDRLLPRLLLPVVSVCVLVLAVVLWGTQQALAPYYYLCMTVLGTVVLGGQRWKGLAQRLQGWSWPVWLKVGLLGYGAVIAEETLVGTLYALNEGFTPGVWMERVAQFVAFNLLAFSGAIWGLAISYTVFPGLRLWHFWQAGLWGLFAESSYLLYVSNPIAGALITPPNISVYAIILAPLMLCLPARQATPKLWQMPVAWAVMLVLSLGPVHLLTHLRGLYPTAFPICDYIACDGSN